MVFFQPTRTTNHFHSAFVPFAAQCLSETLTDKSTYISRYTGRFFLDEKGDSHGPVLIHEMRNSNLPRLVGDRQRRLCEIKDEHDGRYLYLTVSQPMKFGEEDRVPLVRWRRLGMNQETGDPYGGLR